MTELSAGARTLSLAAVITSAFSIGVAFGVGFPLTALTLEAWGEPKWVIGLAGAAPAIGILIALPFLPAVLRRLGTVKAMTIGAALAGFSFLCLAVVTTAPAWIAMRIAMSAALAAPWLAGETWINLVTREEVRGRVIALYAMAFFSGFAVGPLVLSMVGTAGIIPFLIGAGGTALAALPILAARRHAPDITGEIGQSPRKAIVLAPVAMVAALMSGLTETSYLSLIANVGLASGFTEDRAVRLLSLLTAGGIGLQLPIGWLADKTERGGVIIGLALACTGLTLLLPWALTIPFGAEILAVLLGGVILGFYSVGLAIIGQSVRAADMAPANAAFILLYQVGSIVGPVTAGVAMTASPVSGFVGAVVVLMLAALVVILVVRGKA